MLEVGIRELCCIWNVTLGRILLFLKNEGWVDATDQAD